MKVKIVIITKEFVEIDEDEFNNFTEDNLLVLRDRDTELESIDIYKQLV